MSFFAQLSEYFTTLLGGYQNQITAQLANYFSASQGINAATQSIIATQQQQYTQQQLAAYFNPLEAWLNQFQSSVYGTIFNQLNPAINAIVPQLVTQLPATIVNPVNLFLGAKLDVYQSAFQTFAMQLQAQTLATQQATIDAVNTSNTVQTQTITAAFDGAQTAISEDLGPYTDAWLDIKKTDLTATMGSIAKSIENDHKTMMEKVTKPTGSYNPYFSWMYLYEYTLGATQWIEALGLTLLAAECASLGQIDICLEFMWKVPFMKNFQELGGKDTVVIFEKGLMPLATQWVQWCMRPNLPPLKDLTEMAQRGFMPWTKVIEIAQLQGLPDDYAIAYEKLAHPIPNVRDFINFVVHEAYERVPVDPAPEQYMTEAGLTGYERKWLQLYWSEHWRLPGTEQVFDMMHRNVSMPYSVQEYLRIADIAPEWRQPLVDISYSLIPRIDLRKVYKVGRIDDAELTRRYGLLGFSPEDSVFEAEAQKDYILTSSRTAKKSAIGKYYKAGFLPDEQLLNELLKIPMSQAEAQEWRESIAWEGLLDFLNDTAKLYLTQFEKGEILDTVCVFRLTELGMRQDIAKLQVRTVIAKKAKGGVLRIAE